MSDGATAPLHAFSGSESSDIVVLKMSTMVTAIPTMTGWGMIVFMLLAGLMGVFYMRRRAYSA
ncbi:MAG TPA: IPTL-CTERM sorting domain-containing protein [Nitrospirae bacterium]|nr:IPTL-CTERM sorting domain-containing protein [Nitrospirota bacterium]HDO35037.1 IPTL-CTERM sorting domain-containing protein [Nitrospirota bacterium]